MKKRFVFLITVLFIIGLLLSCSPKDESSGGEFVVEISNDTGSIELEIPEGALPVGVNEQDISITPVLESEVEEGVVMYELKPDGLEFNKPVTVTITQEAGPGEVIPMLFLITDEEFEIIPDTVVEISLDTGKTSISGDITHFTRVGTDYMNSIFTYYIYSGGDGFIGDTFPFTIILEADQNWHWSFNKMFGWRIAPEFKWSVQSFGVRSTTGRLEPIVIESTKQTMAVTEEFKFKSSHICEEVGEDTLKPTKAISIAYVLERVWKDYRNASIAESYKEIKNATTGIYVRKGYGDYTCKDPPVAPSPPPVTTPQYILTIGIVGSGIVNTTPTTTAFDAYSEGEVVIIEAVPDSGWQFDGWDGDTVANPALASTTITMDSDKKIFANFTEEEEETEDEVVRVIVNAANVVTDTRVDLVEGDEVEISVDPDQIWSAGSDDPFSRKSNADGISPELYAQLTQGNLTANYGALVGQIGDGEYFLIGTDFVGMVSESGRLSLYYWYDWFPDNSGQVEVKIRVINNQGN
ncbi:hypothetical protein ACFLTP_02870 [Chloroflexota bacterium]